MGILIKELKTYFKIAYKPRSSNISQCRVFVLHAQALGLTLALQTEKKIS